MLLDLQNKYKRIIVCCQVETETQLLRLRGVDRGFGSFCKGLWEVQHLLFVIQASGS